VDACRRVAWALGFSHGCPGLFFGEYSLDAEALLPAAGPSPAEPATVSVPAVVGLPLWGVATGRILRSGSILLVLVAAILVLFPCQTTKGGAAAMGVLCLETWFALRGSVLHLSLSGYGRAA
jgi:hypothetical protein